MSQEKNRRNIFKEETHFQCQNSKSKDKWQKISVQTNLQYSLIYLLPNSDGQPEILHQEGDTPQQIIQNKSLAGYQYIV